MDELPRDQKDLLALCRAQGWYVQKTANGHWRVESPSPQRHVVIASGTPSDSNAVKDFRSRLKRAGLTTSLVEREKAVEKEPKLVVDKNPPNAAPVAAVATPIAAPPPHKKLQGQLRDAILDSMRRVNRGGGMSPDDILTHVKAKVPETTIDRINSSMAGMVGTGWLKRESPGRYTIVPNGPIRMASRKPHKNARSAVDLNMDGDLAVLERAIGCLGELELLIKKHQQIVKSMAGLKALVNQMGGTGGPES